jgi:hypothetical protein
LLVKIVATLALGLRPRERGCKVAGQKGDLGVTSHAFGSAKSVREWTLTLPSDLPCWELESRNDSRIFKAWLQGSKLFALKSFIIEKILKCRCLKWACIAHLDIWNTSYGQKKGRESNWQFDSWPLKVGNRLDFLTCRQHATYRWKNLDEGYNFVSYLIAIGGLHRKLYALKVAGILVVKILGIALGNLGIKSHLDVGPMERRKVYYKGEGGGFPQVQAVVSLMCPGCSWLVLAPKML